jgi:2-phosphoglycerate kinase
MKDLKVVQKEGEEIVPAQVVASSIKKIAESFARMKKAGLSDRAIVLLIHDASGVGKPAVKDVLAGIDQLAKLYLRDWKKS